MSRIVFLLEERSMKVLLEGLLPRLIPEVSPGMDFLCVPHDGKQALEKSIPKKLRAWKIPGDRFVVLRDNDGGDCLALKEKLHQLCTSNNCNNALVRIACQELEAWYFGEPEALADAFGDEKLRTIGLKAPFRNPDNISAPSHELEKLIPEFQKIEGARRMAEHLSIERNQSKSFQVLIEAIQRLFQEMKKRDPLG